MEIDAKKISNLKVQLKQSKSANEKDRLRSILSHFEHNKTAKEISKVMYLHEQTIQSYINDFLNEEKTKNDPRGGSSSKLSEEQSQELKLHLQEKTYTKVKDVVEYVKKKYQVLYTISGMRFWMRENGFVYKKPVSVPGKLDPNKQDQFIQEYKDLKDSLSEKEAIVFMDAVHPEYQSRPAYGWILKGEVKHLSSTGTQTRINIIGGLELGSSKNRKHSVTTLAVEKVNSQEAIRFLDLLSQKYEDKEKIYLICDNGSAFKSKEIKTYLSKNLKIEIKYLPTYSPNLNPIERLWKIFREHVQYNQYYEKFNFFKIKVNEFFDKTIHKIKNKIYRRINDSFQTFKLNLIKT